MLIKKKNKSDNFFNIINKSIKNKSNYVCVWGAGYIGLSTACYFAKKGKKVIAIDNNQNYLNDLKKGRLKNDDFKKWLGISVKPLIKKQNLIFSRDIVQIRSKEPLIHFIAIPTEKNGRPFDKILKEVIKKIIKNFDYGLIIIESTLTPGTSEKILKKYFASKIKKKKFFYAVAPRRDWFVDNSKNLELMDRVYGGSNDESGILAKNILSMICKKLHRASSHKISEMVKSFENAYRHVDIALANQLSEAYPNENIREALKLVGTKWNIGTFYPGFGSGGYCIPLSSRYVVLGSKFKNKLGILKETIKTDRDINIKIAKSIIRKKFKKIAILGLSYKEDLKVHILSPVLPLIKYLKKNKINCQIYDPYYSTNEIKNITKINSFNFKKDLKKFDCIIYHVNHSFFKKNKKLIIKSLRCKYFLDNTGEYLEKADLFNKMKITYKTTGSSKWI
ncbi:nucleotide sugar dehydrogenase [Candidatus Pelagibacter sp.]|nr:nucleotide sugar dehydrogenase [Candidatus Pelagibacter sp.]